MENILRSASQQPEPVKSSVLSIDFYGLKITISWSLNTWAKVGLDLSSRKTLCCESKKDCKLPQGTAIKRLLVVSIQVYSVELQIAPGT